MLGGCPARVRIPPWGGRERSADKSTCVKGMPLMNCKYLYVCWLSHLPYVNGGGGIAPFPPVAYLCIDVLPILKSAIRDPAERPVAWDFRAGSRFLCPRVCRVVFGRRGGRDLAPTVGHTLHSLSFVLLFLSRFAFRPVLLYLCTGKGSTRVFPFFISPAHHCPQNPEMAYLPG